MSLEGLTDARRSHAELLLGIARTLQVEHSECEDATVKAVLAVLNATTLDAYEAITGSDA